MIPILAYAIRILSSHRECGSMMHTNVESTIALQLASGFVATTKVMTTE
jgi:hypothetical protein